MYTLTRNDPLFEEAMAKIRGNAKKEDDVPEAIGARLISSSLMATGADPQAANIRVKLPDKDDEDLSEADNDAEKEMESNERMKIKLEAQLRYDKMVKNKIKSKPGAVTILSSGGSTSNLKK